MAEIHRFDRVHSTMDLLHEMAAAGAEPGTVVVASEQSGGRGSRGRPWHSGRGGLWCSILYRPASGAGAELASIRVGLATAETLGALGLKEQVGLKWPNDVMLNERKLGGILCEARWQGEQLSWIASGIGINVRNPLPEAIATTATSLEQHLEDLGIEDLFQQLIARLVVLDLSGPSLSGPELQRWARRDWLRGRPLRRPVAGTAQGLGDDGCLLVRGEDGSISRCRAGSVELAPSPAHP
jgi:BirA family biotin operon repressor/biotin-[acetyl-CoA-carboxylase] ligase